MALVSAGVLTTALGRHMPGRTLAWALLTGAAVAGYTVIDAQGVRAAPSAPSYIVWSFVIDGAVIGLAPFAAWRGPRFVATARAQWRVGLLAGAGSIVSYGLALWALRLGATPRLAALRGAAILFAVVIAIVFLKEKASVARLAGVAIIAASMSPASELERNPPTFGSCLVQSPLPLAGGKVAAASGRIEVSAG